MNMRSAFMASAAAAFLAVSAHGQVTQVGEFTGDLSENFENIAPPGTFNGVIFGGSATMMDNLAGNPVITTVLTDTTNNLFAYDGSFMGLVPTGWTTFTFDTPIIKFGGYIAHLTAAGTSGSISFYDDSNALIYAEALDVQYNTWAWHGWESDTPISKIVVSMNETPGAVAVFDNLELTFVPAPGAAALLAIGACGVRRRRR